MQHPRATGRRTGPPSAAGEQEAGDIRESGEGEGKPGRGQVLNVRARGGPRASGRNSRCRAGEGPAAPSERLRSALACGSGSPRPPALPLRGCLPCQAPRTNMRRDRPGKPQRARGPSGSLPATHGPRGEGLSPEVSRTTRVAGGLRGPQRTVWGLAGGQWDAGLGTPLSQRPGEVPSCIRTWGQAAHSPCPLPRAPAGTLPQLQSWGHGQGWTWMHQKLKRSTGPLRVGEEPS